MIPGSLAALGAVWGVLAVAVFRGFTNRGAVRTAINQIYARLLEIRLYSEEPSLVWRAQRALIVGNLRFLALIAPAVLIMAVPFALLYPQLDAIYGISPLQVGHTATVTWTTNDLSGTLQTPPGIVVETAPLKDPDEHEISWRIRAVAPTRGTLRIALPGGGVATRTITAGEPTLTPNRRSDSSIKIDYPPAEVAIAGLTLPWITWFLLISVIAGTLGLQMLPLVKASNATRRDDVPKASD